MQQGVSQDQKFPVILWSDAYNLNSKDRSNLRAWVYSTKTFWDETLQTIKNIMYGSHIQLSKS